METTSNNPATLSSLHRLAALKELHTTYSPFVPPKDVDLYAISYAVRIMRTLLGKPTGTIQARTFQKFFATPPILNTFPTIPVGELNDLALFLVQYCNSLKSINLIQLTLYDMQLGLPATSFPIFQEYLLKWIHEFKISPIPRISYSIPAHADSNSTS